MTNGDRTVHRTVADYGSDGVGRYIALDEPLGESFAAGETVVRYPDEQMHASLGESKRELERLGFEVDTLLAPYDNFDEYSRGSSRSTTTASRTRNTDRGSTTGTGSIRTGPVGTTSSSSPPASRCNEISTRSPNAVRWAFSAHTRSKRRSRRNVSERPSNGSMSATSRC
ncbi:hypothetical protein [Halalkalicoccus salilacus]|uniref:hypothetical protein n=1 Tax=Halalkalicoccus sp. GCM10025704 TaxID=3252662 RepID=UPI003605FFBE